MILYEDILFMVQQADAAAHAKGEELTTILMNQAMLNVVRKVKQSDFIGAYEVKVMDALPDGKIILE